MKYQSQIEKYLWHSINLSDVLHATWRDYEVEIYNNLVFRFPKHPEKIQHIQKEKQILDVVSKYVSLDVPRYTLINNSFIVYPEIRGVSLDSLTIWYSETVLADVVSFLKQLHSIPLSEVSFLEKKSEWKDDSLIAFVDGFKTRIQNKLQSLVWQNIIDDIHAYMDNLFFEYTSVEKALVHTDIQPKNIIYNLDTQKVSGIIDFTDTRIGGIELDFCYFYDQGEDLLRKVIKMYRGLDDEELFDRVAFLVKRWVLFEIDNDEVYNQDFNYIINQLKKYKFM